MSTYRCTVCGYLHTGSVDFYFCPVCNSSASVFAHESNGNNFGIWNTNVRQMRNYLVDQQK